MKETLDTYNHDDVMQDFFQDSPFHPLCTPPNGNENYFELSLNISRTEVL
jgi:hypothetical protein